MTPWTAARQASLSVTTSRSLLSFMSIESVMPSNHLILCRPLLFLPSVFPSRIFSNESVLRIRWPKCWSFSFSISPSNEYAGLISLRIRDTGGGKLTRTDSQETWFYSPICHLQPVQLGTNLSVSSSPVSSSVWWEGVKLLWVGEV